MKLAILVTVIALPHAVAAPDDLAPPPPELGAADVKLDLPAVPSFEAQGALYEGTYTVKELRVAGGKLRDTTVTVDGVVTWVYDCATAERRPGESDRDVKKRIEDDPTLCERAKFYVGDTADTRPEQSLWVVDVPRPYNKAELQHIKKADRTMPDRCEPGDKKQKVCPPYKVGDRVTVTGDFKLRSPHSEMNSDGLLVYHGMENVNAKWKSAGFAFTAKLAAYGPYHAAAPQRPQLPAIVKTKPQPRFDYEAGASHAAHGEWNEAVAAFERAAEQRPDVAMYQMWLGIALYEQIVQRERETTAKRENRKPEEVHPDLSAVVFDKPLVHLLLAVREEPRLWRAQYYLGRIDRDTGAWKAAAEDFTRAIQANPHQSAPYIALAEIYRRWDYTDEAIAVAMQAVQNTRDPDTSFELGMGYDDKRMDQQAIEAFSKALEVRQNNSHALFMRGQAYYRMGDFVKAKRDLEAVLGFGLASEQRAAANMMLAHIAAKAAGK